MCKTISHAVKYCILVCSFNEHKVQNPYTCLKEMFNKAFNRKKLPKTFIVNNKKVIKKKECFRTKASFQSLLRNQHDTTEPNGNL